MTGTGFNVYPPFAMHNIGDGDIGAHPPTEDVSWQESWGLAWHDPHTRTGGFHHFGLQRNRGYADVWSWIAKDDAVVGRFNHLRHPLPEQDLPNFALGPMQVSHSQPRSLQFTSTFPDASVSLDYEAFTEPFGWSLKPDLIAMGTSHYESLGRVTGALRTAQGETAVNGGAWHDHSWGPRNWGAALSSRWVWANFGPDLYISVFSIVTAGPPVLAGFVHDNGVFHGVAHANFGAQIADDGKTPTGCDMRLWTQSGRGYHLTATVGASSSVAHDGGFWMTDGLATFELGGRLGVGFVEVNELSTPLDRVEIGLAGTEG